MAVAFSQKKITAELHKKHSKKMVGEKLEDGSGFQNILH